VKTTRLEFVNGTSRKFWEVSTKGTTMLLRYGRIGTEGQTKSQTFVANVQADGQAAYLIRQKLAKGYVRVRGPSGKAPSVAPKKRAVSAEEAIVTAISAWLKAAASRLKAPRTPPRKLRFAKGIVEVTRADGKKVRGNPVLANLDDDDAVELTNGRFVWEWSGGA
jgi:predicted DNA-binding WGR domain protein